jgi:hypothetical protein
LKCGEGLDGQKIALNGKNSTHGDSVSDSLCPKKLSLIQKMPIDRIAWLRLCDFGGDSDHWSLSQEEKIIRWAFEPDLAAILKVSLGATPSSANRPIHH